jgi:RNA polymerase sigma factor (sigma-70 family)
LAAVPSTGRADQVDRLAAPEADATRALYERYANQIFGYCLHQLGSREEAEDAVQSTFLNAFRGLKRGVVPEMEAAWLFKIAHNVCLSRRRSSWRRGRVESPADFELVEELAPAPSRRADELIGLQDVLETMPENQRRAILLREWQGLSYHEIADELGLSQSAVETLIFRARRSLASGLEQPPEQAKRRLRARAGDLGNLLAGIKSMLLGSAAAVKVAATVAVISATTVVVDVLALSGRRWDRARADAGRGAPERFGRSFAPPGRLGPRLTRAHRRRSVRSDRRRRRKRSTDGHADLDHVLDAAVGRPAGPAGARAAGPAGRSRAGRAADVRRDGRTDPEDAGRNRQHADGVGDAAQPERDARPERRERPGPVRIELERKQLLVRPVLLVGHDDDAGEHAAVASHPADPCAGARRHDSGHDDVGDDQPGHDVAAVEHIRQPDDDDRHDDHGHRRPAQPARLDRPLDHVRLRGHNDESLSRRARAEHRGPA